MGLTLIVFVLVRITPGDPVLIMLGEDATDPETIEAARRALGLDKPIYIQYIKFMSRLVKGDLGRSLMTKRPVLDVILERFPKTITLAVAAMVIALPIALTAGILSAVKPNSILDKLFMVTALMGVSTPSFWQALIFILVFSFYLRLTPVSGSGTIGHLILPAITLGTGLTAVTARLTRSSMLDVLNQDYIRTARAKGLKEVAVILRHAVKNAFIPVITVLGLQFGSLLGGAFLIESVFAWPGIGRLAIDAINNRDYPLVQGSVLVSSMAFVLMNLIVDITYLYLDPRIRYE
jgi:peptide/nickel transport system permease protein